MKRDAKISKLKKHRNKIGMLYPPDNKIKLTTSTYQPYVSINKSETQRMYTNVGLLCESDYFNFVGKVSYFCAFISFDIPINMSFRSYSCFDYFVYF